MKQKRNIVIKIFLFSLVFYLALINVIYFVSFIQDKNKLQNLESRINSLKVQNEYLSVEIKNEKTDNFIEKVARENLMLAKKGETVIYFNFANTNKPANNKPTTNGFLEKTFVKVLHLFKK